jgi:ADP-dependent NAD(P)H-hydrate dehydratase
MNAPKNIDVNLLRGMPLPSLEGETDKNSRGRVLVVGGSRRVPGAVVLSGMAALRVGAGKIQLAIPGSLAPAIGLTALEAGLCPLHENSDGEALAIPSEALTSIAREVDAVLIGPGIMDQQAASDLVRLLLARVIGPIYVIDALALCDLWEQEELLHHHGGRVVLTPHAGEMAQLCGEEKGKVGADPLGLARRAAAHLGSCIVLKGATTYIVSPSGPAYVHAKGVVGLATAGSGDVLAGIIAGIASRGVAPVVAATWGVFMHGRAGGHLTETVGKVGFIARELVDELPTLLEAIEASIGAGLQ